MSKFQFMSGGEVWPDRETLTLGNLIGISMGSTDRSLSIRDKDGREFLTKSIEVIDTGDGRSMLVIRLEPKAGKTRIPFKIPKDFDRKLAAVARLNDGSVLPMLMQGDQDETGRSAIYVGLAD